jgi:hypothetical protein
MAVLNQKFGAALDAAFRRSFNSGNSGNLPDAGFKDNVAVLWISISRQGVRPATTPGWPT